VKLLGNIRVDFDTIDKPLIRFSASAKHWIKVGVPVSIAKGYGLEGRRSIPRRNKKLFSSLQQPYWL
jgi:hypothetical protein